MSIETQLDQQSLRRIHWRVMLVAGLGWLFAGLEVTLIGFIVVALSRSWGLGPEQARAVLGVGLAGMAIGAAGAGLLADRYGRRPVLLGSVILFAGATGLTGVLAALVPALGALLGLRFLAGLGLGGAWPTAAVLVAEVAPARWRGLLGVLLAGCWAGGALLAALVAFLVLPRVGWAWGFVVGALPLLATRLLSDRLPESPRYLLQAGRASTAAAALRDLGLAPTGDDLRAAARAAARARPLDGVLLAWRPPLRRRTALLWLVWFGLAYAAFGLPTWLPPLLTERGYPLTQSLGVVLVTTLAQVPGFLSAALLVERLGRARTLALYLLLAGLTSVLLGRHAFTSGGSLGEVLLWAALVQCFGLGAWGVLGAYTPELYPTAIRASGVGWAMASGWLGGLAGLVVVPGLLDPAGAFRLDPRLLLGIFALVPALAAAATLIWGVETRGQPLPSGADDGPASVGRGAHRWVG